METLGFVIEVPLMALFRPCLPSGLADSRALQEPPGTRLTLAGLVAASRITTTTDGKPMQFLTLADEWGLVEVTLFPDICPILASPALGPYLVTGQIEEHLGARTLRAIQRRNCACSVPEAIARISPDARPVTIESECSAI
jgi:DNA polymerase III alpha subunit